MLHILLLSLLISSIISAAIDSNESASARPPLDMSEHKLDDLPIELVCNIMSFGIQTQGALSACCKYFKTTADERKPYLSSLARNLRLPALMDVPLHVDLEALDGFVVPDTRQGKFAKIRLLGQRIGKTISRSPIVGHLKKIHHNEIMALAPTMTLQEWDSIGLIYKANSFFVSYYTMVNDLVESGKLDELDLMMSTSRVRFPSITESLHSHDYATRSRTAFIKIVEYLRDKPNRFRPLMGTINHATLPILLACDYPPEELEMILNGSGEMQGIINFLDAVKDVLKGDLSYLSDETVIFWQFQVLLPILRVVHESSPEHIKASINQVEVTNRLRFNQLVDASELATLEPSLASVILIRVKRYEEAITMLPANSEDLNLPNIISDPEFCRALALMKEPAWIRNYFDADRDLIWKDRSLIAAYYGISSVETEFSKIIDKTIRRAVPVMWKKMLPTLLEVGTKADIHKYLQKAKKVSSRNVWIELFHSANVLGPERFKFCVLAILEVSRLIDNSVKIPFSAAKAIVEDAELFAAFADNEQPIRLQCDTYSFVLAWKDNQNFEFIMAHMQQLSLIITNLGDIGHECNSPLEIARAYALFGNGKTMEQFLAGLLKHEFKKSCGSNGENRDFVYTDRIVSLFSHWRKVNQLKTIEGIPEDLEEMERRVREAIRHQSLLKDSKYLSKFEKQSYFTLFLLKCDYFNDY